MATLETSLEANSDRHMYRQKRKRGLAPYRGSSYSSAQKADHCHSQIIELHGFVLVAGCQHIVQSKQNSCLSRPWLITEQLYSHSQKLSWKIGMSVDITGGSFKNFNTSKYVMEVIEVDELDKSTICNSKRRQIFKD